jgi:maltose alpha-D-glucosyltransferase/alpha-amylase
VGEDRSVLEPNISKTDQENTTVFYGDRFALKFLRRIEPGPLPEREIGELLTQKGFPHIAPLAGWLEYRAEGSDPMTVALLHGFVRDAKDAWLYTLDHLGLFFELALARGPAGPPEEGLSAEAIQELMGAYLETVRLLGTRTGELHAALAAETENPAFAPEPFTDFYRYGLYHGVLTRFGRAMEELRGCLPRLPENARIDAKAVLDHQAAIRGGLQFLRDQRVSAMRIRIHGDYHLSQALYTGKDYVIIDFEGDVTRPLSERRIKRSPLEDVAGMLDSFYHVAHSVVLGEAPGVIPQAEKLPALEAWAKFWFRTVGPEFVRAYRAIPGVAPLLPTEPDHVRALLTIFRLEQALRKLSSALVHAPEHIRIPAQAILELVEHA